MRVAHVVCTAEFAGVERYVTTLARGLAAAGVEVSVLGGDSPRMRAALAGAEVDHAPAQTPSAALRELRRRGPFDLVHAHMTAAELAAAVADCLRSTRPAAPLVSTRHFAQTRGSSLAGRAVGRLVTRRVAAQLAISRFVAAHIEGESVVIAPGTPDVLSPPPVSSREPFVLVAQRLEAEKRTQDALEAWSASGLGDRGWILNIAGEGAERVSLEAHARSLGISHSCCFLGARADIAELHGRASMLLAPRPDEPFGLSVIEAMAAGLPVVAAAGGGHDETVGSCSGAALYRRGDFAHAGRLLAELAFDPVRRARYAEALRAVQQDRFSMARQVGETLEVYESL